MGERGEIHPDLQSAYERDLPEAYLPPEVLTGLMGPELAFDDYRLLSLGVRMSPKAIRTLIFAACNGFYDEDGYHLHPSPQFRLNAALYGRFTDMVTKEEFDALAHGKRLNGNFVQEESDLFLTESHPVLRNVLQSRVRGSVEEVALEIERKRKRFPDLKVALLHGKWNGIPHPGHFFSQRDLIEGIFLTTGITERDLVVVVVCDTNQDICAAGVSPFLNTLWRVSLMSYSPYNDYVCPAGEFGSNPDEVDRHWLHLYRLLKPFAVHVSLDHPRRELILERCRQVGAVPYSYPRQADYQPEVGRPFATKLDNVMSSTRVWDGEASDFSVQNYLTKLLCIKDIREMLYGRRDLFGQVLLPNRKIGAVPVLIPQDVRTLIGVAGSAAREPIVISHSNETQLQKALADLGMI